MFDKIFSEYGMTAISVIAGIVIIFGMFFASLTNLGESITNFINSFNN